MLPYSPARGPLSDTQPTQCQDSPLATYSSTFLVNPEDGLAQAGRSASNSFFWEDATERRKKSGRGFRSFFANPWQGWRVIILGSWVNVLFVLIPVSLVLPLVVPNSLALIFGICVLALIPLVKLHDLATRELALRIGGTRTGLLGASMSNVVELVIAISALRKCELRVVQSSLIGSILSKLLLVLGMCFFAGGLRFSEQGFDATATQIHSSLLSISVGAVLLPAAYHFAINASGGADSSSAEQNNDILRMSHGVSVVLLCIYASYLIFQLWSHKHLYQDPSTHSSKHSVKFPRDVSFRSDIIGMCQWARDNRRPPPPAPTVRFSSPYRMSGSQLPTSSEITLTNSDAGSEVSGGAIPAPAVNSTVKLVPLETTSFAGGIPMSRGESSGSGSGSGSGASYFPKNATFLSLQDDRVTRSREQRRQQYGETRILDEKSPQLSWPMTLVLLIVVTALVAAIADCLVGSMDGISATIGKEWIGLILLPAVSSIAECVTAVNVSVKDQLTLSISVAVGSTIQTALFVIPFVVTLAWVMNKPLALLFDPFQCVVLYISVQTMTSVVGDAKSSWLHGVILLCLYVIIAVAFWFYPVSQFSSTLGACSVT